jgi:integrase
MMKWGENIDLRRKTISYTPSKTKRRTNKIVTLPFIHPDLYEALEKALRWEEDGNPYVLPKVADRYMRNPSGISQDATKVFQQAGLETTVKRRGTRRQVKVCQYSFHSFRHTFVSFCAEAGIPLSIVQEIVGHGNPAMTRHYTHISKEAAKNAIKALPSAGEGNEAITVDAVDIYKEKVEKTLIILESAKKLSKREREILSILK